MALGINLPIIQIVGYQNSGKTTFVTKLVKALSNQGLQVGTIKHHGHGGQPDAFDQGKDTENHRKAGAAVTAVEGNGSLQLHSNQHNWDLAKMIDLYAHFDLDVIVIEGYKQANYPKVVLIRSEADLHLLTTLTHVIAIISWVNLENEYPIPCFSIDDEHDYIKWLTKGVRDDDDRKNV